LIDISTTPAGKDPFGELKAVYICLRAPCLTASLQIDRAASQVPIDIAQALFMHVVYKGQSKHIGCDLDYNIPIPQTFSDSATEDSIEIIPGGHEDSRATIASQSGYIGVPEYENALLILIAEHHWLSGARTCRCLALRSIDIEMQTYERFSTAYIFSKDFSCYADLQNETRTITIIS
jgi:hypothetical protein